MKRTILPGLALLAATGLGVCGLAEAAQTSSAGKPKSASAAKTSQSSSKSGSSKGKRSSKKASSRSRRDKGQKAPTPDRISEIQQALAKDGSFSGTPNGKWDDSTVDAMKKFQAGHGLNPSGRLDAPTLQKLGLGSQTAGVAPPVTTANSSARVPPRSMGGANALTQTVERR